MKKALFVVISIYACSCDAGHASSPIDPASHPKNATFGISVSKDGKAFMRTDIGGLVAAGGTISDATWHQTGFASCPVTGPLTGLRVDIGWSIYLTIEPDGSQLISAKAVDLDPARIDPVKHCASTDPVRSAEWNDIRATLKAGQSYDLPTIGGFAMRITRGNDI